MSTKIYLLQKQFHNEVDDSFSSTSLNNVKMSEFVKTAF